MRILGIDPGYDRLGIAVIDKIDGLKETVFYSACFETSAKDSIYDRLHQVGTEISRVINKYKPDTVAIESLFISKNQKTAMRVSEARGIILYEALRNKVTVHEYSPMTIKMAVTGDGTSDKSRIIKMVNMLVSINKKSVLDDEYDAIAVALTDCAHNKHRLIHS